MTRMLFASTLSILIALVPVGRPTDAADGPCDIYAILSQTGSAAFLGTEEARTLKTIEAIQNAHGGLRGRPIRFVIEDDQSSPQVAVELMNLVVSKHVPVVLGTSIVATCKAIASLAKDGPLVYCFTPGIRPELNPRDNHYLFSSSISTGDMLKASAIYFEQVGWKKVAVITSTDATGQDADRSVSDAFIASSGEQIVDQEHFNVTDVSVSAQMAHIKASGAQAVIAWTTGTPAATVLRGLVNAGIKLPVLLGNGNLTYAQMETYKSYLPPDVLFAAPPSIAPEQLSRGAVKTAVQSFVDAFKSTGVRPDYSHALAWDPTMLILSALNKLGLEASPSQIAGYINGLRSWAGVDGQYDFQKLPQRGVGQDSTVIVRWVAENNRWVGLSKLGGVPLK